MSFRIIGNLCRNTNKSLNKVKLSCCANTKRSMMNGSQKPRLKTNSDSSQSSLSNDNNQDHYGIGSETKSSLFKKMFKKYKRRNPAPDLSKVVVGLKSLTEWSLVTLSGRPGLYIIPNALREDAVELWLQRTFKYAEPPNITNLTAHGTSPKSDVLKNAGKSLRWTTLGVHYNWDTKEYPLTGDALPSELVQFADVVTRALRLGPMYADATIVNYYPPKSTLSPHVDRSERIGAPLVSLSLGQSAVYLTGGESLDDDVVPLWLHSGDVLVMHGAQRLVYHAVAAIHKTCAFEFDDPYLKEFANTSRVNITIRQVNPLENGNVDENR
ncbi:putative alkylated DNA repair protein AlkB [Necator americanus]|uniref:Putative alkylated DNA repair protein AlkB n=1 Tax=Necator americanus TaxID=51031 RepID=W2T1S3_NECAM|nr:putative alkylated DNA repair protein AlkB [Necator americanus]ETN74922.1 putative alkylated DNA repair protein AlkB [Necator americanus]